MAKPMVHAINATKRWGGKPEDYIQLHDHMDSTKGAMADNRHRMVTHNAWYIAPDGPLERIFGKTIINSDGRIVHVRDVGEQHCLEDFGGVIPTLQDWATAVESKPWMSGMGRPPSCENQMGDREVRVD